MWAVWRLPVSTAVRCTAGELVYVSEWIPLSVAGGNIESVCRYARCHRATAVILADII